jgi:hypothetical protein
MTEQEARERQNWLALIGALTVLIERSPMSDAGRAEMVSTRDRFIGLIVDQTAVLVDALDAA